MTRAFSFALILATISCVAARSDAALAPSTAGDVTGVWDSIADARLHVQSGMKCPLYIRAEESQIDPSHARLNYIPLESVAIVSSDRPRGDNVACNYRDGEGREAILSATRLRSGEDHSALFAAAKAQILKNFPSAKEVYYRPGSQMDDFRYLGQGHRHAEIASFRLHDGTQVGTFAIIVDRTNGWAVEVELLDLTDDTTQVVERTASISWMLTDQIKAAQH